MDKKQARLNTRALNNVRLQFWHYEYLKRHLLSKNKILCRDIFNASEFIFERLVDKIECDDKKDILSHVIYVCILNANFPNCSNNKSKYNEIMDNIGDSERGKYCIRTLYQASYKYGYNAHKLICPIPMDYILNGLNRNENSVYINSDVLLIKQDCSKFKVGISPHQSEIVDGCGNLTLSLNLLDEGFDFSKIQDEIALHISARRHVLKCIGAKISLSLEEVERLVRGYLPEGTEYIPKSSDISRAVGLWSWDYNHLGEHAFYWAGMGKSPDSPSFYNSHECASGKIKGASLLIKLLELKLLKNFHNENRDGQKILAPCDDIYNNCLNFIDKDKKHSLTSKNGKCEHFDSCTRKVNFVYQNAQKCIDKARVIPISAK
ncbi:MULTISPECIES: hypothetical protein [unclassified Desulfovibrio]|uniref:hypothetical protein n=1 Tax=unclassified Desulfovibrio TaxID=2593640 RepID=UPI002FD89A1B